MVINAAGAHACHVARMVGLELPIVPVRHEYFITVPIGGIRPDCRAFRVPDPTLYGRPDVNALLLGGWEPAALSLDPRSYPLQARRRRSSRTGRCSRTSPSFFAPFFPPVARPACGACSAAGRPSRPTAASSSARAGACEGFVMAGGCNAHGVSGSAGIGRHVVEALLEPEPSAYVRSLGPDRFARRRLGLGRGAAAGAGGLRDLL